MSEPIDEIGLLREFVQRQSHAAFATLVQRRVGLVYHIALPHVGGDTHLAEDVVQRVFTELARSAPSLLDRPTVSGWLCRTTRYIAIDMGRAERRRQARERRTELMADASSDPERAAPETLRPLLDELLNGLAERDRDAVALRFFESQPFADIGRKLRITEDAARKRVDRALDEMARALSRRGLTSTSAAIATALGEAAAWAAPQELAPKVTGAALAGAAARAGAGFAAAGVKAAAVAAVLALVAGAFLLREHRRASDSERQVATLTRETATLRDEVGQLQARLAEAIQRAGAAEDDNARLLAAIGRVKDSRTTGGGMETAVVPAPRVAAAPEIRLRLIQLSRKPGESDASLLAQANVILTRFNAGEPFASLATEFSSDAKRAKGGDWGWQKMTDFKPNISTIALALAKGQVSAPVLMPEGCFLLFAQDRR